MVEAVNEGHWEEEVEVFSMDLPISSASDFLDDIAGLQEDVGAAAVDVAPKKGETDRDAPPN